VRKSDSALSEGANAYAHRFRYSVGTAQELKVSDLPLPDNYLWHQGREKRVHVGGATQERTKKRQKSAENRLSDIVRELSPLIKELKQHHS
jgi:cell fate regulator YaaT (PSP1 superfamily)